MNAETQGLWLLDQSLEVARADGSIINVVFVDTEGLGDYDKLQNNDVKIFMLALLVSSHCIFNVKEKLDSTAID